MTCQAPRCICRSLVKGLLDGYNATVFAYGQTGSGACPGFDLRAPATQPAHAAAMCVALSSPGKTYTMGIGSSTGWGEGVEQGIVPRVVQDLFAAIHDHQAAHRSSRGDTLVLGSLSGQAKRQARTELLYANSCVLKSHGFSVAL